MIRMVKVSQLEMIDHSFFGNRRPQANNVNHDSQDNNELPPFTSGQTVPYFTPDQYNHLLKLIDKDSIPKVALANMAGIVCPIPSTFNTSHACSVVGN